MSASFPAGIKSFTPIVDGVDFPQAAQIDQAYDEITAIETVLINGIVTFGNWTPTDASGASLVLVNPVGQYVKVGPLMRVWGAATYPATGSGSNAIIGGLPTAAIAFANGGYAGAVGFYNGSLDIYTYVNPGTSNVLFYKNSGAAILNSDMNGRTIYFSGEYRVVP